MVDVLAETQEKLVYPTFQLDSAALDGLAIALIEFGEDIHAKIGFWRALENYQIGFFGTPLPLVLPVGETLNGPFDPRRVQYFLYVLWRQLKPDHVISPNHPDLVEMANEAAKFLAASFESLPRESSIGRFLRTPNRRGWEVKRKLYWTGHRSYLFRDECARYLKDQDAKLGSIDVIDDFICQESTAWSGLGVIDLLAATLDFLETDRAALRTWYERHRAAYLIVSAEKLGVITETLQAVNVINDQTYQIRMEMESCPFAPGQLILGSLTPWRGEWYWSGTQRNLTDDPSPEEIGELKKDYVEKSPALAYRCRPDLVQKARELVLEQSKDFVEYYGDNLVVFPDGLALAAAEQKRLKSIYEQRPREIIQNVMKRHGLRNPWPTLTFPESFLKHDNGIAVFFNSEEGVEYMGGFHTIQTAFAKQNEELTDDESEGIRKVIESPVISSAFVERLVREYGSHVIGNAYLIRDFHPEPDLAYLLRRFKGQFFRNRYPSLAFKQGDATP
jgi:hypothetical protein